MRSKKHKRRLLLLLIVLALGSLGSVFFWPKSYAVADRQARANTQYWDLSTGSRIAYYKQAADSLSQAYPIIYLHGGPGGQILDTHIQSLAFLSEQGYDVYYYDQIGSGQSARLEDITEYSVARHAADLKAIIEAIGAEKVILLGHSWGCLLAINFVQNWPERVERMILEGPGPILPIRESLARIEAPDSLGLMAPEASNAEGNLQSYNYRMKLVRKWANVFGRKLAPDSEVDSFFTLLNTNLNKSTSCAAADSEAYPPGGGYYAHIMTYKSFFTVPDKRPMLQSLQIPTLILRGQCDNQAWGYTQEYLELLPQVQLEIIEGAGHDLIGGGLEEYQGLIRGWL